MTAEFAIKDSGARQEFDGGAVRDTEEGKLDFSNLFVWFEPMGTRYVAHMTKGRSKYPDPEPGVPNWSLFEATPETLARTERSLDRHYKAYRMGQTDEDHAAAILFNLNLAEKIRSALGSRSNLDAIDDLGRSVVRTMGYRGLRTERQPLFPTRDDEFEIEGTPV